MGDGTELCANYVKLYALDPTHTESVYFSWAEGYMSARNIDTFVADKWAFRDLSVWSVEEQKRFIRQYCDNHPLAEFSKAVKTLYEQFPLRTDQPN